MNSPTHSQAPSYELVATLGPLAQYLRDPLVTDIFVNGESGVWVDRGEGARKDPLLEITREDARGLAVKLISRGGRHIDEATPCVDVRLGWGLRVHAVLPPIARDGPLISIRIPRATALSLNDLFSLGMFGNNTWNMLKTALEDKRNILISGAGGSGKTTLLAALMGCVPEEERIVTIEDVAELNIQHPHCVSLEARQKNLDGAGGIDLAQLLREALRMRPNRIVVGECRGPELRELLAALNTGHDGGAGTLHANSLADVPARLEALGATAGFLPHALARQVVSAIHLVVQLERVNGKRRVVELGRFHCDERGALTIENYSA